MVGSAEPVVVTVGTADTVWDVVPEALLLGDELLVGDFVGSEVVVEVPLPDTEAELEADAVLVPVLEVVAVEEGEEEMVTVEVALADDVAELVADGELVRVAVGDESVIVAEEEGEPDELTLDVIVPEPDAVDEGNDEVDALDEGTAE